MAYQIIQQYKFLFQNIKSELEQAVIENKQKKLGKNLLVELGARFLKSQAIIPKNLSRSSVNLLSPNNISYLNEIERNFSPVFRQFMVDLSKISIKNKNGKTNSDKLKSKFNMVNRVSRLDTKLKHVMNKIDEILLLDLVLNEILTRNEKTSISNVNYFKDYTNFRELFSDELLKIILFNEGMRGESTIIEFKRELNPHKKEKIALIICSMANTNSGILFFGWDEVKKAFNDIDFEKIEQQLIQIIDNLISPLLEFLLHKINNNGCKGLLLAIPFTRKIFSINK